MDKELLNAEQILYEVLARTKACCETAEEKREVIATLSDCASRLIVLRLEMIRSRNCEKI